VFVTAVFVRLDPSHRSFYYNQLGPRGAPDPPRRRCGVALIEGRTIPLGVTNDFSLGPQEIARLDPGDCLVLSRRHRVGA
jgi:hypothetical protein